MEVAPMDLEVARGYLGENRYEVLDVPDEENGFLVFDEILKRMPGPEAPDFGAPSGPGGMGAPAEVGLEDVEDLEGIWAEVDRALAMPVWQPKGAYLDIESMEGNGFMVSKDLIKLGVLDARRSIEAGDRSAGIEKLLRVWKVADRFGERSASLIHHLVVVACRAVAAKGVQDLLEEGLLTAEDARRIMDGAPSASGLRTSLEMAMRGEATFYVIPFAAKKSVEEIVVSLETGGMVMLEEEVNVDELVLTRLFSGVKDPIDREATVRGIADYYNRVVQDASVPGDEAIQVQENQNRLHELWGSEEGLSGARFDEARKVVRKIDNPLGSLLLDYSAPMFSQSKSSLCRAMAGERLLMIELAALATGARSLEGLGLEGEALVDPFTGERFRYDPATRWVWSVGDKRLADDGEVVPNEQEVAGFLGAYLRARL